MAELFLKLMDMSISASWLVLAVVILRQVLKRVPKQINLVLWGITALRLVLPFSIQSPFSLIPSIQALSPEMMYPQEPAIQSGIPVSNTAADPTFTEVFVPDIAPGTDPLQIWIFVASIIWAAGVAIMQLYTVFSFVRLHRRMRTAVPLRDNIYQSEKAATPFVLGLLRPKIYIPFYVNLESTTHVIAHEQAHIKRLDHILKPLGFALLSLHWFNPLIWLSYILFCRDVELACDARVIKALTPRQRANYAQVLLSCSVHRGSIAACPIAFGEIGVKQRVKNILTYKKPALWFTVLAVAVCVLFTGCFLTDPVENTVTRVDANTSNTVCTDSTCTDPTHIHKTSAGNVPAETPNPQETTSIDSPPNTEPAETTSAVQPQETTAPLETEPVEERTSLEKGNQQTSYESTVSEEPCSPRTCTDPSHGHAAYCSGENCTDPAHNHDGVCTVENCTDGSHGHESVLVESNTVQSEQPVVLTDSSDDLSPKNSTSHHSEEAHSDHHK